MDKKTILIITQNPLHNGPRLVREIDAFKKDFTIVAVGSTAPHDSSISYIPINEIGISLIEKIYQKAYKTVVKKPYLGLLPIVNRRINHLLKRVNPEIVIIHSPILLPYFLSVKNRKFKVVYNAHEFHPLEFESDKLWLTYYGVLYMHIYKTNLHQVDLLVNVCKSIAERCKLEYGKESIVIPNAAFYYPNVNPTIVQQDSIKLVHHGAAIKEREIEVMIDAVLKLDELYTLDLILVPSDLTYFNYLKSTYKGYSRIRFIAPVSFNEIVPFLNQYDIGLFNLPPVNYNYKVALPNKLFEFIQARLCIVVSPSVEMKHIVETYQLGKVSGNFSADEFAKAIESLSIDEIMFHKNQSDHNAFTLSDNKYSALYLTEVKKMIES